jgi:hypothetical protein
MRRPRAILWCEGLALVALVLRVGSALRSDGAARIAHLDAVTAPGTGLILIGFGLVAPTALALWATRGRSRAAAWFLVVWVALLAVSGVVQILQGSIRLNLFGLVILLTVLIYLVMAVLLFASSARRWLRNEKDAAEIADLFA